MELACWHSVQQRCVGSIDSTGQVNTKAGFSIITYTSPNNTAEQTVAHGLSKAPELILAKMRTGTFVWDIHHKDALFPKSLVFNTAVPRTGGFSSTLPSSTVFGTKNGYTHAGTLTYVAYCFHSVAGFSKVGSYVGNGNTSGTYVELGFSPALVIIKTISTTNRWVMFDNIRSPINPVEEAQELNPSDTTAESSSGTDCLDFLSSGFKLRRTGDVFNTSGHTYIYYAVAKQPFKFANAR